MTKIKTSGCFIRNTQKKRVDNNILDRDIQSPNIYLESKKTRKHQDVRTEG